jgi:hypothetical protein
VGGVSFACWPLVSFFWVAARNGFHAGKTGGEISCKRFRGILQGLMLAEKEIP